MARRATMLETDFQTTVIQMAMRLGWYIHHCRAARLPSGRIATPIQGNKGFPDNCLVRDGRLIFAELKSDTGTIEEEQREWLGRLREVFGIEVYVWWPRDLDEIERVLR